jgi:hypothetical protein
MTPKPFDHNARYHHVPLVWPPPETYAGMRALVRELLPGARYRRHTGFRYSARLDGVTRLS